MELGKTSVRAKLKLMGGCEAHMFRLKQRSSMKVMLNYALLGCIIFLCFLLVVMGIASESFPFLINAESARVSSRLLSSPGLRILVGVFAVVVALGALFKECYFSKFSHRLKINGLLALVLLWVQPILIA